MFLPIARKPSGFSARPNTVIRQGLLRAEKLKILPWSLGCWFYFQALLFLLELGSDLLPLFGASSRWRPYFRLLLSLPCWSTGLSVYHVNYLVSLPLVGGSPGPPDGRYSCQAGGHSLLRPWLAGETELLGSRPENIVSGDSKNRGLDPGIWPSNRYANLPGQWIG